jgi:hypothetical protein
MSSINVLMAEKQTIILVFIGKDVFESNGQKITYDASSQLQS